MLAADQVKKVSRKHCFCFKSLLTFSSGRIFQHHKTYIWVGLLVQSLFSKDDNVLPNIEWNGWGDISASAHAFLGYLWFSIGNIKVVRRNGLEILIPKHMWKSKIGHLEHIWGQNPYDTFFLGHRVHVIDIWISLMIIFLYPVDKEK